jgi:hypothetical protein
MPRASAPVSRDELDSMRGDDSDVATIDAPPTATPRPTGILARLLAHFGPDHVLSHHDWQLLFPRSSAVLELAERQKLLPVAVRNAHDARMKTTTSAGWRVGDAVAFLHARGTDPEESPTLRALFTLEPLEALPLICDETPSGKYSDIGRITGALGIDGVLIDDALRAGKIKNGAFQAHRGLISLEGLETWLEADGVRPRYSVALAALAATHRHDRLVLASETQAAADRAAVAAAERGKSPLHQAMDLVEESRTADKLQGEENRRAMLATYREILLRRRVPEPGDVPALADACRELGITRARVESDARVLDECERLTQVASTIESCRAEVSASGLAKTETERRCAAEVEAVQRRWRGAFQSQAVAASAPGLLAELHRGNPNLFA